MTSVLFAIPSPKVDRPVSMSFAKRLADGIEAAGTPVHRIRIVKSLNPMEFLRQGMALRARIRETRADVVVAQFGSYTGLLVGLFSSRPVIVTFRGSDLNPEPYTNPVVLFLQHAASHIAAWRADGIVCVSRELAARLLVRRPYTVIPSPTDLETFRPLSQQECRRALGWHSGEPVAVFFSGTNPRVKGIHLAKRVQATLAHRGSDVRVLIVEHEVPPAEMPLYLNAADCLLFLSRHEGSPNTVREACACNLPVVGTAAGDVPDVLKHVEPKRIVSFDADQVATALEEICRTRTRSNGRDHMLPYGTPVIARRTLAFYEQVVTAGDPHRSGSRRR